MKKCIIPAIKPHRIKISVGRYSIPAGKNTSCEEKKKTTLAETINILLRNLIILIRKVKYLNERTQIIYRYEFLTIRKKELVQINNQINQSTNK